MEKLKSLPKFLDAEKLARNKINVSGSLLIPNISEICNFADNSDTILVTVYLSFDLDEKKRILLEGNINTEFGLICQRCIKPLHCPVASDFMLLCVDSDDQANDIPDNYEPVVLTNGKLDVSKLVHEEIILSVSIVPYHNIDECSGLQSYQSITKKQNKSSEDVQELANNNPFAILSTLKDNKF